jgi:micrococcal nuclease
VVDGDTVHVDLDGVDVTIRLIGIDTPESVAPGQPVECYARRASRFATRRLEGRDVDLEFDVERLDRYDRTLAYVWLDEELFNETLVAGGYASVTTYPPNVRYVDRFIRAQAAARAAGIGIWGACPDP